MTEMIPKHEFWRRQYSADRYMEAISDAELDLRFADVFTNQLLLCAHGKIGIGAGLWTEKFAHLQAEYSIRGRDFPNAAEIERRLIVPSQASSALSERLKQDYPNGVPPAFTLFKYGKKEHLAPLIDKGSLRLMPASSYEDPSLNPATEDSELHFEKIWKGERTRYRSQFDYYCFCSSFLHLDRLIADFGADSILVVRDPWGFFRRIAETLNETSFQIYFKAVSYLDPLLLDEAEVADVAVVKHMRFAYQFEHRFVAMPTAETPLEPRHLELGSLHDIATLYSG